jgi:hypothetical protein
MFSKHRQNKINKVINWPMVSITNDIKRRIDGIRAEASILIAMQAAAKSSGGNTCSDPCLKWKRIAIPPTANPAKPRADGEIGKPNGFRGYHFDLVYIFLFPHTP